MITRQRIDRFDGRAARRERVTSEECHQQLAVRIRNAGRDGLARRWTERREERVRYIWKRGERRDGAGRNIDVPHSIATAVGYVELIADAHDAEGIGELDVAGYHRVRKGNVVGKV